jgi:hypothetical protein
LVQAFGDPGTASVNADQTGLGPDFGPHLVSERL